MRSLLGEEIERQTHVEKNAEVVLTSSLDIARYICYSDRGNSFSQYGLTEAGE